MDLFRHGYSGYGMDFGLTLLLLRTRQSGALVHDVQMFHPKRREAETVRADPNFVERNREILAYIYETFGSDLRIETVFDSMRYFRRVTRQSLRLTKWLNRPLRVLYGHR